MLQQTQVTTVISYFERWIEAFPDIASLAAAPVDEVLAHWSGLGYYARARNLHQAAVLCMESHGGELPATAEGLGALPGIGQSTANAIVSQSTDQPAAVLDGNVRRVLARHAAIEGWTGKTSAQKLLWKEAESRLPVDRGADYTQAIMDLGAMICTRSMPGCDRCPVSSGCQALKLDKVSELPWPRPATKVTDKTIHMLILKDEQDRVLLEKRPPAGIWGGLWCLPEGDSINTISVGLGISCTVTTALPVVEHRLSHIRMTIRPALTTATDARQVKCSPAHDWFNREQQQGLGLPKPVKDLLSRLNDGEYK
jgi:A/G-specific adenine glycosylase